MTQKHFTALAEGLHERMPKENSENDDLWMEQWNYDCHAIANVCKQFNPKFKFAKFIRACEGRD